MRHARFVGECRIEIGDAQWPAASSGEALLRVAACSLCGSDLRPLRNGWPVTPGHEIAGTVDQPGHHLHGQRCLVYIPVWCGQCATCEAGHTQLCENATDLIGWQRAGGYAEALAVPEQCLLPVPDDIPDHTATLLLDTIGTAAHGVRLSQALVPAGRALVLGAGPIGLGALLVLQQFGYGPIDVFDPNPYRRQVAGDLGGVPLASLEGRVRYALVLECSGKDAARQSALELVAEMAAVRRNGFLFPGTKPGRPLSQMALSMLLRRMGYGLQLISCLLFFTRHRNLRSKRTRRHNCDHVFCDGLRFDCDWDHIEPLGACVHSRSLDARLHHRCRLSPDFRLARHFQT